MILGPVLAWLLLPFVVLLLFLVQRNQEIRPEIFKSKPVEYLDDFDRTGRLGRMIRLAYLRTIGDPSPYPGRKLSAVERRYAALRIRRIYTRLLKLSTEVDYDFHPSLSPFDILQAMRWLFPDLKEDLATITESYARLVFGELPERQYQLDVVERSWLRVQAYVDVRKRNSPVQGWCHDKPGCPCS